MKLLGPRLKMPFVAAVILAAYAACYALVLLVIIPDLMRPTSTGFVMVFGLFLLAATPFMALFQIARVRRPQADKPVRPILMTFVMMAPTIFWSYVGADSFVPYGYYNFGTLVTAVLVLWVPALLSLWLAVTFALIAIRDRRQGAQTR